MYPRLYGAAAVLVLFGGLGDAQTFDRRANFTGGGGPGEGKCTLEVVVDGAAQVEIQGDHALLRNLSGGAPQWRRFQCNLPMPANPVNFRFQGVDGRGSQKLIREPRGGGPAVVRIDDPDNGSQSYTFDIMWQGAGFVPQPGPGPAPDRRFGQDRDRGPDRGPGYRGRMPVDAAIRTCQDAVRDQARDRLRDAHIDFRRTTIDDHPGRQDWVIGTFEASRGNGRGRVDVYSFSCSVDFDNGRVRSADFQPANRR